MGKKLLLVFGKLIRKFLCLKKTEKIFFLFFLGLIIFGFLSLVVKFYFNHSVEVPKPGGILKLGLVGQPQYLNPILSRNNDIDRFLIEILYNGLLKVDGKGNLENDLASKIEVSRDGKTILIFLKENVFWHDKVPFSADDVVFTIETIQNKDYKSPLRDVWEGVVVEKISPMVLRLTLNKPQKTFLENLTLKILPKHIWENIDSKSFPLTDYNIKPIGTGPFLFENLEKNNKGDIISYTLIRNDDYFQNQPYLFKIKFNFYDSYSEMKNALLKNEIGGMLPLYIEDLEFFSNKRNFKVERLETNRYFAVFYNLDKEVFKDTNVREALELAINKKELKEKILKNQAILINSPFSKKEETISEYNPEKARELLKDKKISFTLSVPEDYQLIRVAQYLKENWEKIGLEVSLEIFPLKELEREVILPKNYEALLFGEIVNQSYELFPFWHSSQAVPYRLNLSSYKSKELDKLIEENWNIDENKRLENYQKMEEIFLKEKPALFLYNPYYLYLFPKKLEGNKIEKANLPSEIFIDINQWYLKSERVLKFK